MDNQVSKPTINIIAAISQNLVLGNDNKLLWHIPEDFARFKKITSGHPVIMGRKTFESIGKPLSDRTNIIITHDENYNAEGCLIVYSLEDALKTAKSSFAKASADAKALADESAGKKIFIIGGGQIYKQAITLADKLYLTVIKKDFSGDTYFPDYSRFKKIIYKKDGKSGNLEYTFLELVV
ncbi:dihydrofolate reductase [Candidatus Gottesmanbacteria bacterium]|nr:dihydrofolate reductase [Candidatus Gottesmanbacteria bacterium]